jgi:hypothetical protein
VIEQYWPVGEPAANLRALISGDMGPKDEAQGKTIWAKLKGVFKPVNEAKKKALMQEQIKRFFR